MTTIPRLPKRRRRPTANPDLQAFGTKLRSLRQAQDWTQLRVATALHLSVAYISLLERGGRNPPFLRVCRFARLLGASPSALFPD